MANLGTLIITKKGQELITSILAGTETGVKFTHVSSSSKEYADSDLESLEALEDIKQTIEPSSITAVSGNTVMVDAIFSNKDLTEGYDLNTIGLYATPTDGTEILYAVCRETTGTLAVPAYNGVTSTDLVIDLYTLCGNSENISLEISEAAYASAKEFKAHTNTNTVAAYAHGLYFDKETGRLKVKDEDGNIFDADEDTRKQVTDIKAFIGYTESDIYGVEVDFKNKKFTRLAGAANLSAGSDFDSIQPWGGRRRCNVTNAGEVIAYYGDDGYTETGALTKTVTVGSTTYAVGTKVQVMVEQPKFYYKVVPLELEKISGGKGFHMRKARYYVSATKKEGFKVHPAFVRNGSEKNFIYPSAFEGCLYDTSASKYITDDSQVMDTSADLLCSIAGAKPASGISQSLTRAACRQLAANRGTGWTQETVQAAAATELLFLIEYASFNTQESIGRGVCDKTDDGKTNMSNNTGATSSLGNASGIASGTNGLTSVTYRGEENFWSNIWDWIDGLNHCKQSIFIADHDFKDDTGDSPYSDAGITASYSGGFVSAFAYNEAYDWLFIASECLGDSALPVGDYFWINPTYGWLVAQLGAAWGDASGVGGFYWYLNDVSSFRYRSIGGRLLYTPDGTDPLVKAA